MKLGYVPSDWIALANGERIHCTNLADADATRTSDLFHLSSKNCHPGNRRLLAASRIDIFNSQVVYVQLMSGHSFIRPLENARKGTAEYSGGH